MGEQSTFRRGFPVKLSWLENWVKGERPAAETSAPAVREGGYVPLNEGDPYVMSYLRRYRDDAVLVVINMSGEDRTATFDLSAQGLRGAAGRPIIQSAASGDLNSVKLGPYGIFIADVKTAP